MATHDYVIDNSTGANVRADINSVLQAILSNNSNSSAPGTTAAYMWWADTTNGVLKIRNSANNAWVELLQLDGTLTLEDGSASTPALAFRDDLDTGIYSSDDNKFNVATAGAERMELAASGTVFNEDGADVDFRIEGDTEANLFYVDAGNDRIGIGTSSPGSLVHLSNDTDVEIRITNTDTTLSDGAQIGRLAFYTSDTTTPTGAGEVFNINSFSANSGADYTTTLFNRGGSAGGSTMLRFAEGEIRFSTSTAGNSATQKMVVDSDGRMLIGISTPRTYEQPEPFGGSDTVPALQLEGTGASGGTHRVFAQTYNNNDVYAATHIFAKTRGGATGSVNIVNSGDPLGILSFQGADGVDLEEAAQIRAEVDGTPGSNDMPGRLIFSTTADGAHAPSTRMIIDSSGNLLVGRTSAGNTGNGHSIRGNDGVIFSRNASGETVQIARNSSDGDIVQFRSGDTGNASSIGEISKSGGNVVYGGTSDYRLKENVVTLSNAITRLKTLKPYRFNFKSHPTRTVDGFFAHEVTPAVPEAVVGEKDDSSRMQSLDQSKIVPLLTAALQEAISKIEVLETKVAALEAA